MNKQLQMLNQGLGVRGSLVITKDGVVVASNLGDGLEVETVGALTSSVIQALMNPATSFRMGSFQAGDITRFTLTAKYGRLIFEIKESLVLVVVTDKKIDLEFTLLEIAGTANRLQRMINISV